MQPNKLYQITVSSSHTLKCKGLLEALSGMQADVCQVRLLYVVPTDRFASIKAQSIARGERIATLKTEQQQCVLEVSLTN